MAFARGELPDRPDVSRRVVRIVAASMQENIRPNDQ